MKKRYLLVLVLATSLYSSSLDGKKVFETYCWGCHHETSVAFGPSFQEIANKRTKTQMITHISAPKSDFKELGYKRSVMPSFGTTLNKKELDLIVDFIMAQKDKK